MLVDKYEYKSKNDWLLDKHTNIFYHNPVYLLSYLAFYPKMQDYYHNDLQLLYFLEEQQGQLGVHWSFVFPFHNVELSWESNCPARGHIFQLSCI